MEKVKYCTEGCMMDMINNHICNPECHNEDCFYDGNDCEAQCSIGCKNDFLLNMYCDNRCNSKDCDYDNYFCECAPGCSKILLLNNRCDQVCNTHNCGFDYGECPKNEDRFLGVALTIILSSAAVAILAVLFLILKRRSRSQSTDIGKTAISPTDFRLLIKEIQYTDEFLGDSCAICLYSYLPEQAIAQLKCSHFFHSECIFQWLLLEAHTNCPICSTPYNQ